MNICKHNKFFIQKKLIRFLLEPLAIITEKVSSKIKNAIFVITGILITMLYFIQGSGLISVRYLFYFCIGCLLLGVMILCTLKPNMQPVKFRPFIMICWFIIGATMLYSGIFNSADFLPEAILFLIAYPIVFIVWNNNNTDEIFKKLITVTDISFIIYLIVSMLLFPMHSLRYSGLFNNVNGAAGYLTIVFSCLLIEVVKEKKISAKFFFHLILLGISIASLMYTNSRTGQLEMIIVFFTFIVVFSISHIKEKKLYIFRNTFLVVISAIIFFYTALYGFQAGNYLPLPKLNADTWTDEEISANDSINLTKDRFSSDETISGTSIINSYSSGRIAIWKEYAMQLNFKGHSDSPPLPILFLPTGTRLLEVLV